MIFSQAMILLIGQLLWVRMRRVRVDLLIQIRGIVLSLRLIRLVKVLAMVEFWLLMIVLAAATCKLFMLRSQALVI